MIRMIRHAETIINEKSCVGGTVDAPLTPRGIAMTNKMGEALRLHSNGKSMEVWISPAKRCADTLAILSDYINPSRVLIHDDLKPVDSGSWNGRPFSDVISETGMSEADIATGSIMWAFKNPTGEDFNNFTDRCHRVIKKAIVSPGDILLITHGFVGRGISSYCQHGGVISDVTMRTSATSRGSFYVLGKNAMSIDEHLVCDEQMVPIKALK